MALDDDQEAALRREMDEIRAALAKSNREGGQHRAQADRATKRADEAEAALEVARSEMKTTTDALRAELTGKVEAADQRTAEAKVAADQRIIAAELRTAAVQNGMAKPEYVKMLDTSGVKLDENGVVVIPPDMFEKARNSDASLFGTAPSSTSSTTPPPKPGNDAPKRAVDMDQNERNARAAELGVRLK